LWVLAVWFLLGAIITVACVGQPRKPIKPETAAVAVLINALWIAAIVVFGVR
jgi:hypothetical protein